MIGKERIQRDPRSTRSTHNALRAAAGKAPSQVEFVGSDLAPARVRPISFTHVWQREGTDGAACRFRKRGIFP